MFSYLQTITSSFKSPETGAIDSYLKNKRQNQNSHDSNSENTTHQEHHHYEQNETLEISVQAIILFLEDYLESKLDSSKSERSSSQTKNENNKPWLKQSHSNNNYAIKSATNAYSQSAKINKNTSVNNAQAEHYDLNHIYSLIRNLRTLNNHGIKTLTINTSTSFLESITSAIKNIKL